MTMTTGDDDGSCPRRAGSGCDTWTVFYGFTAVVCRTISCSEIQTTSFTADEILDILIYASPLYGSMQELQTSKNRPFFGQPGIQNI